MLENPKKEAFNMIDRIKKLITDKGLSINQFLKSANLPNSAISEWAKGKAKPSLNAIVKIADYLDCSVDYLLGRTDNPDSHKQ